MKHLSNSAVKTILNAFLLHNSGQIIRQTSNREVYRFMHKDKETYYIKLYYLPNNCLLKFTAYIKRILEYVHHKKLLDRGAPLPPLVGFDTILYHSRKALVLVTKQIPRTIVLSEYISEHGLNYDSKILSSLALFLAKCYLEGFFHNDLHFGNILWIKDTDSFLFVDVAKIRFFRHSNSKKILKNLMTLYPSYYARNDFSEAGWNDFYLNVLRNAGVKNIKSETMVRRQNRIFRRWLRRRTKRCIYSNNDFEVFKNYGVSGVYVKRFQDVWIGSDPISIIERLFQNSDSFYKNSNTTAVGNFKLNNEMVVIKKFKVKRWFNPLKNMLRTSRGRRTWMFGWHLVLQKVPVPQPVFYFEKRVRRLLYENYLGMMYYAHSMPVDKFLLTQTRFNHREFINECASLCRKITESTVYHGDFQLKNILVRYDNGTFSFCIIDLDSIVMSNMNQSKKMEGMLRHLKKSYLRLDTPNTFTKRELMRFCILAFKNVPDKKNVIRRFLKVE